MTIKQKFGYELKKYLNLKKSTEAIGGFAFFYYMKNMPDIDDEFRRFLLDMSTMEEGPQFALPYEMLHQIADALIAGKDVKFP